MAVARRVRATLVPLAFGAASLTLAFNPTFHTTKHLGPATARPSPFSGKKLYVDPQSPARRQAEGWRSSRPVDAALIDRIARQPQAYWITDSIDTRNTVARLVNRIARSGALPLLVAYHITDRDCGWYSSGGARSDEQYRRWIREFAAGLGGERVVVVLEPDALGLSCLNTETAALRADLLHDAVAVLKRRGAAVYVDAGHPHWVQPDIMAARLRRAGIQHATGFALNVANFHTTADNIRYGEHLSRLLGGKHFIIDTSRNGNGSKQGRWCNVSGSALGETPTAQTGHPLVDAFLWIKRPGESDGPCAGGPKAGEWWPSYALELAGGQPLVFVSRN